MIFSLNKPNALIFTKDKFINKMYLGNQPIIEDEPFYPSDKLHSTDGLEYNMAQAKVGEYSYAYSSGGNPYYRGFVFLKADAEIVVSKCCTKTCFRLDRWNGSAPKDKSQLFKVEICSILDDSVLCSAIISLLSNRYGYLEMELKRQDGTSAGKWQGGFGSSTKMNVVYYNGTGFTFLLNEGYGSTIEMGFTPYYVRFINLYGDNNPSVLSFSEMDPNPKPPYRQFVDPNGLLCTTTYLNTSEGTNDIATTRRINNDLTFSFILKKPLQQTTALTYNISKTYNN